MPEPKKTHRKPLAYGWAWVKDQQVPIIETREIKRGKDKGRIEVLFRVTKRAVIDRDAVTVWPTAHGGG